MKSATEAYRLGLDVSSLLLTPHLTPAVDDPNCSPYDPSKDLACLRNELRGELDRTDRLIESFQQKLVDCRKHDDRTVNLIQMRAVLNDVSFSSCSQQLSTDILLFSS